MLQHSALIRALINAAFSDQELINFCFDHFRPVYDQFAADMNRQRKIQLLLEYGEKQGHIEQLLALIKDLNPAQYHKYEPWLNEANTSSTLSNSQTEETHWAAGRLRRLIQAPSLKIKLAAAEKVLLQRLFADNQYLVIEQEFTGGYSPTRVFRVTPWREGLELAAQVVKLGPLALIADEKDRHDRYVKDSLPLLAAQITRFAYQDDLGAMAYTFIGGSVLGRTMSLKDYYQEHSTHQIEAILQRLLERALGHCWYSKTLPVQEPPFFVQFYGRFFPADLTLSAEIISQSDPPIPPPTYRHLPADVSLWEYQELELGQPLQVEGFEVEQQKGERLDLIRSDRLVRLRVLVESDEIRGVQLLSGQEVWLRGRITGRRWDELSRVVTEIFDDSKVTEQTVLTGETITFAGKYYPNPLNLYQAILDRPLPINLSLTHGDLHLLNVIVDSDHKPWLIDFGRVEKGHAIFDFVELETHLRHIILSQTPYNLTELADFEHRLIYATIGAAAPPPVEPNLAKAFAVIRIIRTLAADYLARRNDFRGEYLPALFLYTLSTLRHYKENGPRSARHAFVTAAVIAGYLTNQLDGFSPRLVPVTDPSLYYYVYYLKKAADDTQAEEDARQQFFKAELQQAADTLRQFLGLSQMPIHWRNDPSGDTNTMILRFHSDQWQDSKGQTLAWLIAHETHDTYVLKVILCRVGPNQPSEVLEELRRQFPWYPDTNRPEFLGQSFFYAGLSTASAPEVARAVFDTASLQHTSLTCGELYRPRSSEELYLLVFARSEQEDQANTFFNQMAPELGWYTSKVFRQVKECEIYLYETIESKKGRVSTLLTEIQSLQAGLNLEERDEHSLILFNRHLRVLEIAILEYDKLLIKARSVLKGIKINVENYCRVTRPGEFLATSGQDQIFAEQQVRLKLSSDQFEVHLEYWQSNLQEAKNDLEILKTSRQLLSWSGS